MRKFVLGFVVLAVVLSGCGVPQENSGGGEPLGDFSFTYRTGAMHAEWGQYRLAVDAGGNAEFVKEIGKLLSKKYEFSISENEMESISNAISGNNFFGLRDEYKDPSIMDGGYSEISVSSGGRTKTVHVLNTEVSEFGNVEDAINSVLANRLENPYSFDDLKAECGDAQGECSGNETGKCADWQAFCGWAA